MAAGDHQHLIINTAIFALFAGNFFHPRSGTTSPRPGSAGKRLSGVMSVWETLKAAQIFHPHR